MTLVRRLVWQSVSPLQASCNMQSPARLQHLKPSPSAEGEGGPLAVDEVSPPQAGCNMQAPKRLLPIADLQRRDSHTSDIGHWFGMTRFACALRAGERIATPVCAPMSLS